MVLKDISLKSDPGGLKAPQGFGILSLDGE